MHETGSGRTLADCAHPSGGSAGGDEQARTLLADVDEVEGVDAVHLLVQRVEQFDRGQTPLTDAMDLLIERCRSKGHVTLAELNAAMPDDCTSPEAIEAAIEYLEDRGLDIYEP